MCVTASSDVMLFSSFLAETCPGEFAKQPIFRAHETWLDTLKLYLVKPATIFIAFHVKHEVSKMKVP